MDYTREIREEVVRFIKKRTGVSIEDITIFVLPYVYADIRHSARESHYFRGCQDEPMRIHGCRIHVVASDYNHPPYRLMVAATHFEA